MSEVHTSIRVFTRFFASLLGAVEGLLGEQLSLPDARVLFEIADMPGVSALKLATVIRMDGGQVSRIVRSLERRGLIERIADRRDGRIKTLALTDGGKRVLTELEASSDRQLAMLLRHLPIAEQRQLAEALSHARLLLGDRPGDQPRLRRHRTGDIGWMIKRHGELCAAELGWNGTLEAEVAQIATAFLADHDPERERCWIAEQAGRRIGSVLLTGSDTPDVCRLQLLLVEPSARHQGVGQRLTRQCLSFAKEVGYRRITAWTSPAMYEAHRLLRVYGFALINERTHERYGPPVVGQTWALAF